jgi:hypothetical protein
VPHQARLTRDPLGPGLSRVIKATQSRLHVRRRRQRRGEDDSVLQPLAPTLTQSRSHRVRCVSGQDHPSAHICLERRKIVDVVTQDASRIDFGEQFGNRRMPLAKAPPHLRELVLAVPALRNPCASVAVDLPILELATAEAFAAPRGLGQLNGSFDLVGNEAPASVTRIARWPRLGKERPAPSAWPFSYSTTARSFSLRTRWALAPVCRTCRGNLRKAEVDPFDAERTAEINQALKDFGFCLALPGVSFESGGCGTSKSRNRASWPTS